MSDAGARRPLSTPRERFVWCLYDFGNSAFPTVIITAVYVLYFKEVVVGDTRGSGRGDYLWGTATSLGAALVFLSAPFLGALADRGARKRAFLRVHAWLCVAATLALSAAGAGDVALAVVCLVVAVYGFEAGNVFYNGFLPELVPKREIPSFSGKAWAFGYFGGAGCLLLVLAARGLGVSPGLFPLVVGLWFFAFTLPTLVVLRDRPRSAPRAAGGILASLARALGERGFRRFLVAFFLYNNGLNTVYVFTVAFTSQSLGFSLGENIVLVLMLQFIAAPGAYGFGRLATRVGSKRAILITLVLWLAVVAGALVAAWPGVFERASAKLFFWGVAALASVCIGATQATSRGYMAELAPPGESGEYFGFLALSGRASAILGPFVFGQLSFASGGDQRLAVASIGAFFVAGLVLLLRAPEARDAGHFARDAEM